MPYSSERQALGRLLVACAVTDGTPIDPDLVRRARLAIGELPRAARYHGIGPGAWLALRDASLPGAVARELEAQHRRAILWHLLMLGQLARVGRALDEAGVPWLTFKGPVVSETVYPRPDLRQYVDLDVLVAPGRFPEALDAVLALGGGVVEHDWSSVLDEMKGELNVALRAGGVVDLHWSLLYDARLRRQFALDDAELMARRRPAVLSDGSAVPTFDPTDALLHLLLHACLAGGQRLGWMRDIQLAAAAPGVDADALLARARRAGLELCVGVMLHRVRKTIGVPSLPAVLDEALAGGERWTDLIAAFDRLRPADAWRSGQLSGHIVIGSTRRSTRSSRGQFAERARHELAILRTDRDHPWRRVLRRQPIGTGPSLLTLAPSDSPLRPAYLRAVADQASAADNRR